MELNSKQRKYLEKESHNLSPVVIVGGAGVTEGLLKMVSTSIEAHELIKIKFNEFKDEKAELTNHICKETDSILVRIIGNVSILYRPKTEIANRVFEKTLNKFANSQE
ncbi:MAG: YhbY family RNA-binding protein [Spirochaetaceae bacterium]|nr:YhbY family RNA-binding protein [Spirochaetaceae bacterium]